MMMMMEVMGMLMMEMVMWMLNDGSSPSAVGDGYRGSRTYV